MKKGQQMSLEQKKKYSEFWKNKRKGKENPHWKTGKWTDKDGYVMIYSPDHPFTSYGKYVREHRLVMEKHLKRYLKPGEVIHHINGIKNDNRLENLILTKNQGEHIHKHNIKRKRNIKGQFID